MNIKKVILGFANFVKTILTVIVLAFLIRTFLVQTYIIEGPSMEPNFSTGQYLLLDKLSYRIRQPKTGEVVVLHPPKDNEINYIKRVIGIPGDTIFIKDGKVLRNGIIIDEPYLKPGTFTQAEGVTQAIALGPGEYFVMGDNRPQSKDSRSIGVITREEILGRTFLIVFPLASAHFVINY